MDEVMQRNAALVEQAAAAAVSMREQAHGLVESAAAFQVA
ncbi:Methyl-accepting chemotaxis protein I (serine chemoreceptor protein) [Caballeronia sordidicola]|uniref:Methyl-accepting chemotaxis protein I (Serine chemoreceptor protein) n=1 Tax=Caballeronia sordidicola TaxID=196367 RepID=A0A226WZM1_CABSO|nr:Methyl-accepting chemotaxis protein I (serine chemoreceptor protein) [Caballeronia sordidicola]OXC77217.1 Methyl-accepting chemotaxis protein I (serine chemoreceptor protein) [Caballeronia sordidicola]